MAPVQNNVKNILIVGVGGQGTLLASKLMGRVCMEQGYDVKVSEVHGMSQRGGSVVTYVRYGDKVWSSLIEQGEADLIVSFEQLESARWLAWLKPGGVLVTNTQCMDPMPVIMGAAAAIRRAFSTPSGDGDHGGRRGRSGPGRAGGLRQSHQCGAAGRYGPPHGL